MEIIHSTNPFFVRCIKPNSKNSPNVFDRQTVLDQLRYGGIIQAIEISRAGYPIRISNKEFIETFSSIVPIKNCFNEKIFSQNIISYLDSQLKFPRFGANNLCYAVGQTRVFMKKEIWAILNNTRDEIRKNATIRIQNFMKMVMAKNDYSSVRNSLVIVQSLIRTSMVIEGKLRNQAASKIQAAYFSYHVRRYYLYLRECVLKIQKFIRNRILKNYPSSRKRSYSGRWAGRNKENELDDQMQQLGEELRAAKENMKRVSEIPPAPFFQSRRGAIASRGAPIVNVRSSMGGKIGTIEKRLLQVNDDMTKMRELIDRIQNNMTDI
jgi:myosin heavy subunit